MIKKSDYSFSFYNAPISNTKPYKSIGLGEVHQLITGDKFKSDTVKIRTPLVLVCNEDYREQHL
jgi:hypothetical protein